MSVKFSVLIFRDVNKDLTPKDQDKEKDLTPKDQDKDKDLKNVLKESLRTRINIPGTNPLAFVPGGLSFLSINEYLID